MKNKDVTVLCVLRDPLPPKRSDVSILFGQKLPRHGFRCLLVGQLNDLKESFQWTAGQYYGTGKAHGMLASALIPFWDFFNMIRALRHEAVDCVQARDKIASAVLCYFIAAFKHLPFVYWMSFPIVEGHELRAKDIGNKQGFLVFLANKLRAKLSRLFFYGFVIRRADHVFVQSDAMRDWLAKKGFDPQRMTSVPMGVDVDRLQRNQIIPMEDARLQGRRIIIYLGVLAKARHSVFLLELLMLLRKSVPNVLLILAGDAASPDERDWIRAEIAKRSLDEHIILTGWISQDEALRYAVHAEVGLSPFPRGELLDTASPTKLVEYLALGIPTVANDIPDQQLIIEKSGAGICVPMELLAFHDAVLQLLHDQPFRQTCAEAGPAFVRAERSYEILGERVAATYRTILKPRQS